MTRAFLVVVGFCLLLVSCTQRMICPAYQSAYIYDKDAMRKKFSYFTGDSTPKVYSASKTKYLIAEPTTYKKKLRSLQTVPMKPVNTVVPDSLLDNGEITKEELDMAAQSIIDSTYIVDVQPADSIQSAEDSVYMISKDREMRILKYDPMKRQYFVDTVGYNTEQNNYMWYLRDVLVLPDARLAQLQNEEAKKEGTGKNKASSKKEKKGIKGFFAGLFKKKDKSTLVQDSTLTTTPVEEEDYGYDDFDGKVRDSTSVQAESQQPAPKQKKGMFSFLKKDKNKPEKKKTAPTPAKKEEDTDGGF
jgi:hypothetical protein